MASRQEPPSGLLPSSSYQSEEKVLEKLRQLRLWQQRQQEELFLQQQLELDLLRQSKLKQEEEMEEEEEEEYKNSSSETNTSFIGNNQPVHSNPLQPAGHTHSGSSIASNQSADSGMLSGHSCHDVDLTRRRGQVNEVDDGSSGFETPESDDVLSETDEANNKELPVSQPLQIVISASHDEQPLQPGIGPGQSASTFEELLENKLQQYQVTDELQQPLSQYSSTPPNQSSLARCSSQDSFFGRKEQREKREEAELAEFELLERAAEETSFTSQCSIVTRALANCQPSSTSSPLSLKNTASIRNEVKEEPSGGLGSPSQITDMRSLHRERASLTESVLDVDEEPLLVMGERKGPPLPHFPLPSVQEEEGLSDFNSTLTTDGEEGRERFGDEEEWGSFKSTPMQIPPVLASTCTTSTESSPYSSPKKLIALTSASIPHSSDFSSSVSLPAHSPTPPPHASAPVRKVKVLASQGKTESQETDNPPLPSGDTVSAPSLPPPSSLVAKLFPSLSKERASSQAKIKPTTTNMQQPFVPSQPPTASIPQYQGPSLSTVHQTTAPFPKVGPSGIEGVSDEIQDKLLQLEKEINTFKTENAALERLRVEKEQGLLSLKEEVERFEREKELEMNNFEQYKEDEIRKLKRERKVFEMYQKESKSQKDKKEKEERAALRKELEDLREELRQKEQRWSSTLSRYRLRIESLESQNEELQKDLRMMEEQRLLQWQKQLESKRSPKERRVASTTQSHNLPVNSKAPVTSKGMATSGIPPVNTAPVMGAASRNKRTATNRSTSSDRNKTTSKDTAAEKRMKKQTKPSLSLGLRDSTSDVKMEERTVGREQEEQPLVETLANRSVTPEDIRGFINEGLMSDNDEEQNEGDLQSIVINSSDSMITDSDCSIIDVKAVDVSAVSASGGTDSSVCSNKADEIVAQVLQSASEQVLDHEAIRRPMSPVPTLPKSVRFSDDRGGGEREREKGRERSVQLSCSPTNGQSYPPTATIYYYSSSQTTHTTKPDGTEIIKFKNGQSETHYRNGSKDIIFPDGTIRHVLPSGEEKIKFSDGVTQRVLTNGDKIIDFPDGQRETHTSLYKRREYPDGTVKTVYQDGRQETQYANGRLRIKDPDGRVVLDRLPTVPPPLKATPHSFSQPS
uniref:Centromere protein J C-terminal domain-containing protein n=1 Tax=Amphimedon queenslandica TaxID=400682 RepID=A0A1X7TNW4_AMPQE